jgi:hypothetical protein
VSTPAPVVRQIDALLENDTESRLVVFVSRPQLGTALQRAVVRARGSAAGLHPTTPSQYATDLAGLSLRAEGRTELDAGPRFFLTARLLHNLPDAPQEALTDDQPLNGMIAPLARTFSTLRTHSVTPEEYRRRVAASRRQRAISEAFARYEETLDEQGYYDPALLYQTATRLVESGAVSLSASRWAIMNTVSLSGVEKHFVEALARDGPGQGSLFLLGPQRDPTSTDDNEAYAQPPSSLAAAQFPTATVPGDGTASGVGQLVLGTTDSCSEHEAADVRFWTATGVRREVQAVFEDLVEEDRSFDTVEIAYTTPEPYLSLIDTMAERYDLPVSLSGGRAVEATRPGQALAGFFEWVADGGAIPPLIDLLRAGLVTIDCTVEHNDTVIGTLDHRRAATLLAQRRYADDPTSHPDTFDAWIAELDNEIDDLREPDETAAWLDERVTELQHQRATVRTLRNEVQSLLNLGHLEDHSSVGLKEFARSAEQFLEGYGPTPAPSDDEETRTPDESARNRLIERLQTLKQAEDETAYRPRRLARHMTSWLPLSPYVRAQRPQPGCIHVVPLESAGFADRDHLYVVGLDAASTSTRLAEDPLLSDDQREALSDETTTLPRRSNQVDVEEWRTRQALARHTGTLTLTASTYDLDDGEDLFEAPLYLRLKETCQSARGGLEDAEDPQVSHFPLAPTRSAVLSELDRWTSRSRPHPDTLEETLSSQYSWLREGLDAEEARASDTYTEYDGLLAPRDGRSPPGAWNGTPGRRSGTFSGRCWTSRPSTSPLSTTWRGSTPCSEAQSCTTRSAGS